MSRSDRRIFDEQMEGDPQPRLRMVIKFLHCEMIDSYLNVRMYHLYMKRVIMSKNRVVIIVIIVIITIKYSRLEAEK